MSKRIAFLYAGQGSQHTGMGKDFYDSFPKFRDVYDSVKLDFDLKEMCFQNPDNKLIETKYTQPCMVAFACGVTDVLTQKGIIPDCVCGLSLGEYSALYAAGVWTLDDTMKIIAARGRAMSDASKGIDTAMVAITKIELSVVEECCKEAGDVGIVSVCNINCPGQVVIGGDKLAVDKATQLAKEAGARRCVPLAVSGPFHTSYMKTAGEALEKVFEEVTFANPKCEVLYNYLGGPKSNEQKIAELLVNQVQHTVRMKDCIDYMIKQGVDTFIEIGPGEVLSGFVQKTIKTMDKNIEEYKIMSINTVVDVDSVCELFAH